MPFNELERKVDDLIARCEALAWENRTLRERTSFAAPAEPVPARAEPTGEGIGLRAGLDSSDDGDPGVGGDAFSPAPVDDSDDSIDPYHR